nr:aminopeptidase [Bifidobacterium dentium]
MTTETNDRPEPVIWFEGTLISSPRQSGGAEDWLLETMAVGTTTRKIILHASGREHSANIRDHARKGSRLMVKGAAGDEGSGIDIEAISLAFDPSHDEPDGNR